MEAVADFLEQRVLLARPLFLRSRVARVAVVSRAAALRCPQATDREFALGLSLQVVDVYLSALAPSAPPDAALAALLRPFVTLLAQAGARTMHAA